MGAGERNRYSFPYGKKTGVQSLVRSWPEVSVSSLPHGPACLLLQGNLYFQSQQGKDLITVLTLQSCNVYSQSHNLLTALCWVEYIIGRVSLLGSWY